MCDSCILLYIDLVTDLDILHFLHFTKVGIRNEVEFSTPIYSIDLKVLVANVEENVAASCIL